MSYRYHLETEIKISTMKKETTLPEWDNQINNANQKKMEAEFYPKVKPECRHEFISHEYASQPFGTCLECGKTIID